MAEPEAPRARLDAVDFVRGLVMVVMMLDHVRDFAHASAYQFDPLDLGRTTPILYFTRWITHLCAPIFVFLAGASLQFQLQRGKSKAELSTFLLSRGLWLVVCEFTLVRCLIVFNLDYSFLGMAQVIWVIGLSMILMAALIHLPMRALGAFGVALIAGHNLLDRFQAPDRWASLWAILHQQSMLQLGPRHSVFVVYPFIPWVGVMAVGCVFGLVYGWEAARRRAFLLRLGLGLVAAFALVRGLNVYGDPSPWTHQDSPLSTFLSFMKVAKYPPSLDYLLITLGIGVLALAWGEGRSFGRLGRAVVTFGRVPFFFYFLQWLTAHGMTVAASMAAGRPYGHLFLNIPELFTQAQPGAGFGLGVVYAMWISGVLLLYPACRWFAGVKARRRDWWLSYL
jgi:uncharacterized membrane protein